VNGKVLIFRLQILGCDGDEEFLTETEWGWKKFDGDRVRMGTI